MDLILRTAASDNLEKSLKLEKHNTVLIDFLSVQKNGSYINQALFLLQHRGYEILEIKE